MKQIGRPPDQDFKAMEKKERNKTRLQLQNKEHENQTTNVVGMQSKLKET